MILNDGVNVLQDLDKMDMNDYSLDVNVSNLTVDVSSWENKLLFDDPNSTRSDSFEQEVLTDLANTRPDAWDSPLSLDEDNLIPWLELCFNWVIQVGRVMVKK